MADMQMWFLATGMLMIGEMLTGTFYLLVVGIAFAITGLTAWQHWPYWAQLAVAATLTLTNILLLRGRRKTGTRHPSQSLDTGQPVEIIQWLSDNHARVRYRGTEWNAHLAAHTSRQSGNYIIRDIEGSTLIIETSPTTGA